jgi:hypothetical protein
MILRTLTSLLAISTVGLTLLACGDDGDGSGGSGTTTTSTSTTGSSTTGSGTTTSASTTSGSTTSASTTTGTTTSATTTTGGGMGEVVINEVTSNSEDNDRIELFNPGSAAIDLEGYSIIDASGDPENVYTFAAGSMLGAGEYLVLVGDTDHMFGLGGDDAVILLDPAMATVDTADWAADEALVSYCRVPNGTGAFQVCAATTWGAANM